jgi:Ala-tRNA(Pro) deacylase
MLSSEGEFLQFMDANQFVYQRLEHPAVFTCEEAERYHAGIEAVHTKNLFLCDKKKRHFFLVVTDCEKVVRLDSLSKRLGVSHLRFASEENLGGLLGVGKGAVTMMGLVNDTEHRVALWIDKEIWGGERFLCHPLVNTATLVLSKTELERFFALTGHALHFFDETTGMQA